MKILFVVLVVLTLGGVGFLYSNGSDLQGRVRPAFPEITVSNQSYWEARYPGFTETCATLPATSIVVSHFVTRDANSMATSGTPQCL